MRTYGVALLTSVGLFIASCAAPMPGSDVGGRVLSRSPATVIVPIQATREDAMDALAVGTLFIEGRCLRLGQTSSRSYLVIWPATAEFRTIGDSQRLVNRESGDSFRLGDRVAVAGGEVPESRISKLNLTTAVPSDCRGPYWLAGQFRHPST